MFWSGEKIKSRLSEIITLEDGSEPSEKQIDCASYTLRVGSEYFLTPQNNPGPKGNTKQRLELNEQFNFPPGQFIFLSTEEIVNIPRNVIAFISCKTTYKFKGLVNVSGFHVDPGYQGSLVFSLYNTGPKEITLSRGKELFLICFADLDGSGETYFKDNNYKSKVIDDDLVNGITGEIFSPINVKKKLDALKEELGKTKIHIYIWLFSLFFAGIVTIVFSKPIINWFASINNQEFNEKQMKYLQERFQPKNKQIHLQPHKQNNK